VLPLGVAAQDRPLREAYPSDDFAVREAMVPMRDGVKLYTLILTPKKADGPLPILLERTPYDATRAVGGRATQKLDVMRGVRFLGGGYIFVAQDLRGRFKSEGQYAMYRVPRGTFNKTETDETTDAWDTIDWLVKNVTPNNGKVGVWGTSYPGWLTLAALRDPHPALAAAVPFNPVVDTWKADDWFHWGAFRAVYSFDFIYDMETRVGSTVTYPYETRDMYDWLLQQGASGNLGKRLDDRHEMWKQLMAYPSYGQYWKDCAADRWFDAPKRLVPTLHVHGLWDQEDIYGSPAVYAALEKHDTGNDTNFFAAGPWYPRPALRRRRAARRDRIRRGQREALPRGRARAVPREVPEGRRRPRAVARHRVRDGSQPLAEVRPLAARRGRAAAALPAAGRTPRLVGAVGLIGPVGSASDATEYVSDPAKPVPNTPRPMLGFDYDNPPVIGAWRRWLVEDQRFVDGRPDVLTWASEPLAAPLTIRGPVKAKLFAETTGTDADWVVKLIDAYPGDGPEALAMSGYELIVSADIFRGRYRENLEQPKALTPGAVLAYEIPLPIADHTFRRGTA
jgi:predicted acyl esterase